MKKILSLMLAVILCLSLVGNTVAFADGEADPIVLRIGYGTTQDTPEGQASLKFKEVLEELSGGQIKVEVMSNGLAGGDMEILEGMQIGSIEMTLASGLLSNFDSALQILEWPLLIKNEEHLDEFLHGELSEKISARIIETCGMRPLAALKRTPRLMTTTKKIESVEDLKGLKIRVPESKAHVAVWTALGAAPTPMNFNEVYTSLQTGVIEGQENPIGTCITNRFEEVCPYLTLSNHLYGFMYLLISNLTWDSLTEEQQAWVQQAADEAGAYNDELLEDLEAEQLATAEEIFDEVNTIDTSDWREMTKDVYKEFEDDPNYDDMMELYNAIVEAGENLD